MKTEDFSKEQERVLSFVTYTTIYIDDMVCNCVRDIAPFITEDRDKECKKIYKALKKRADSYLDRITKMMGEHIYYLAEYSAKMDETCDLFLEKFRIAVKNLLEEYGVENANYYAYIETMRSVAKFSIETIERLIKDSSKIAPDAMRLKGYILNDLVRVAENFAKWEYRNVAKDLTIELSDDERVLNAFLDLCGSLVSYDDYYDALQVAVKYEKERNKDND